MIPPAAVVAGSMLTGAALMDLAWRRVPNWYWFMFAPAALILLAMDASANGAAAGVWMALGLVLAGGAYLAWYVGVMGGADAKGLMALAIVMPRPADMGFPVPIVAAVFLGGFIVLVLTVPVALFVRNAWRGHWSVPDMLMGTRTRDEATGKPAWRVARPPFLPAALVAFLAIAALAY